MLPVMGMGDVISKLFTVPLVKVRVPSLLRGKGKEVKEVIC